MFLTLFIFGMLPVFLGDPAVAGPQESSGSVRGKASASLQVNLFGQPCVLQGAESESILRAVHAISPEQFPDIGSSEDARLALRKIRKAGTVPTALDAYREQLTKRLEAQLAFFDGLETAQNTQKIQPLLSATKSVLKLRAQPEFEKATQKVAAALLARNADARDQLLDTFNQGIEPDPQEEFHRVIRRIGIQYVCAFEEESGGD